MLGNRRVSTLVVIYLIKTDTNSNFAPIFLGWAIASIVLPRISDIYGRKYLFLGLMVLNFVVGVVLLFSRSIWLTMGMQFLVGWVAVGRWTIGYIMLQEFVPQS